MTRFYTVKQTAKILGLSTNTIYKYLEENRLKSIRGSVKQGRFRIPQSEIDSFVGYSTETEQHQTVPPTVEDTHPSLPAKITRVLLIVSLILVISYLFLNKDFTLVEQIFRLVIISIFTLLTYQTFWLRRKK